MVFEGTQIMFGLLKWVGVLVFAAGVGMAGITGLSVSYPRPEPGTVLMWSMIGGAGLSTWAVAVIGEMVGYSADRARRMVELLEQINAKSN